MEGDATKTVNPALRKALFGACRYGRGNLKVMLRNF